MKIDNLSIFVVAKLVDVLLKLVVVELLLYL
jgi:hypothetical protein